MSSDEWTPNDDLEVDIEWARLFGDVVDVMRVTREAEDRLAGSLAALDQNEMTLREFLASHPADGDAVAQAEDLLARIAALRDEYRRVR